ncbi:MAG: hypothetical protein JSU00_14095 [Acidobacteria bacterium]|nr:hypothetical protein [Acidobacteriota bacterium]
MTRRNPDAIAICVLGLLLFLGSVPRMIVERARWQVTPLRVELPVQHQELRELRKELLEQKDEIRKQADELRRNLRVQ